MEGSRASLTLAYRSAARLFHLFSPEGGARTRGWRGALGLSMAVDVMMFMRLRRSPPLPFGVRAAVDALDGLVWGASPARSADAALLPSLPLLVDLSYQRGAAHAVAPSVIAWSGVAAGRAATGRALPVGTFVWPALTLLAGAGLRRQELQHDQRLELLHERRLEAESTRAFLAGQSEVAIGADTVLDLLIRTVPIIGLPAEGSVLHKLNSAWKASLAEAIGERAVFLGSALLRWERMHNQHPELSGLVTFDPAPGVGTILLTASQAHALRKRLDLLGLGGLVPVGVDHRPAKALPGDALTLIVGDWHVEIPADTTETVRPVDPGPLSLAVLALVSCGTATPDHGGAPVWSVAIPAATVIGMAPRVSRVLGDDPDSNAALWLSLGFAVVHAELMARVLPECLAPPADGTRTYPMIGALTGAAVISQFNWDRLSNRDRVALAAIAAAILVRGWTHVPRPRNFGAAIGDASWLVAATVNGRILKSRMNEVASDVASVLQSTSREAAAQARGEGHRFVIDYLRRALSEGRAHADLVRDTLDDRLFAEAIRRLGEAERMLAELDAREAADEESR